MATDTLFNDILDKLSKIHEEYPDLRFGQVLQTAIDLAKHKPNRDLHNYSSKDILICLHKFLEMTKVNRNNKGKMQALALMEQEATFHKRILDLPRIGKKTALDIVALYPTEQSIKEAVTLKHHLPFRDDIAELLEEEFKEDGKK